MIILQYSMLTLLCIVSSVKVATSLQCYVCIAKENCGDPFNKTAHVADICDHPAAACLKQKLTATASHSAATQRSCADKDHCAVTEKSVKHCSVCYSDLCNSSFSRLPSTIVFILIFIFYFYMYK